MAYKYVNEAPFIRNNREIIHFGDVIDIDGGFIMNYTLGIKESISEESQSLLFTMVEPLSIEDTNDPVSHPAHYTTGDIECIDAMQAAYGTETVKHFCIGNVFKYAWRFKHKNGIEDLNKLMWYVNKYKELDSETCSKTV